ncbi:MULTISPECIES: membrane protein insertase YidC [Brochothrix]|uniref:Membrane protein insertase YidC n=2 Tax=Brochothrix thermosphacta TaxID=2756 RepID=A0A2X0SB37_BROTH|nr:MULTISPECIES: membrane protein insertase YidC [Brochothrix]SLM93747.1 Inner membrane protein translocase component YidC, short form OxaI-like [Brachybacterium faecium]ANZ95148.1 OxaA precursor [Brochothrix thermosphacta]MBR5526449.1 membrane protein insertase YidC [Brochothrix sp.]MDO7864178.1 membrane protein insertase YidC [Brochothrix thermosphacta]ODJ49065.1 OxaA precursor [Brochothrix thermosphacta DSM 20171 = FSL F6-1036]
MKANKKWLLLLMVASLVLVLSACSPTAGAASNPIDANTTGFWSHYIVFPISWLILKLSALAGNSYGMGIILITIVIRLLILPLMVKQLRSQRNMMKLQPKIKEIQAKYKSKDRDTQMLLQQETMALYKENNVNPLAGCLPLLIQMPVLFGLYAAIRRTEVLETGTFLWFNLGQADHMHILPILAAITTFLSTKLSMMSQPKQEGMMASQMSMMLYVMPAFILFAGWSLPSALALYWVIGNIFMVFQTLLINNPFKIRREMAEAQAALDAEKRREEQLTLKEQPSTKKKSKSKKKK